MKKKIPVIFCVDTGIDDAVAILLALKNPKIDIKLLVCGRGNTTIDNSTNNTLNILDYVGAPNIPIVKGKEPSEKRKVLIFKAHGDNGFGSYEFPEQTKREILNVSSDDAIYKVATENEGVIVVSFAPLTSLASAIKKHKDLEQKISKLYIMGGSIREKETNPKPYAEFNIASDPESAKIVFDSSIPKIIVPTEMGRTATFDYYDIYRIKTQNSTGSLIEQLFRHYNSFGYDGGITTCDSTTLFAFTNPEVFKIVPSFCYIKYFDSINSGICLFDFNKTPNVEVATEINAKFFKKIFFKQLKKLP